MKRSIISALSLLIFCAALIPFVVFAQTGTVDCGDDDVVPTLHDGDLSWMCVTATPTGVQLPTSTPQATDVPPTATSTLTPTVAPTPTMASTSTSRATPWLKAPLCAVHDDAKFHALWNDSAINPDGSVGCHYTHGHGDDPLTNSVALKYFRGYISDTISYPHQTIKVQDDGTVVTENQAKHEGYTILCRELIRWDKDGKVYEVNNELNWVGGKTPNVVVASCTQFHRHPYLDELVQKHSYWQITHDCVVTAGVVQLDKCGVSATGGIAHFGVLHCAYKSIYCQLSTDDAVPDNQWLPGVNMDTSGKSIDPYRATNKPCRTSEKTGVLDRLERLSDGWLLDGTKFDDNNRDNWSPWFTGPGVRGGDSTGRGFNHLVGFGQLTTDMAYCMDVDAYRSAQSLEDATKVLLKRIDDQGPANQRRFFNGSEMAIFTVYSLTPPEWDGRKGLDLDGVKNGFVTVNTWVDSRGNLSPCTSAGSNCIALAKVRSPVGWSGWNTGASTALWKNGKAPGNLQNYDVGEAIGANWWGNGEHNH